MIRSRLPRLRTLAFVAVLLGASACHWKSPIKPIRAKHAADTLSLPASVINSHPDPETVRGALDYALLQNEALLAAAPKHESLLETLCSQYVQYATLFVQPQAEALQWSDPGRAPAAAARALRLSERGKDVCWRAIEAEDKDLPGRLIADPDGAVRKIERDDVPLLYWSAASLTSSIVLGGAGRPDSARDWKIVRAMAERGLALDATWNRAALHELMITVESQGEASGGTEEAARRHFTRAVDVQQGLSPGPYLALAMGVVRTKRDRAEFEKLIKQAAAIDPEKDPANRLPATLGRDRARVLAANVAQIFR
jgi:hypothetical protein